MQQIIDRCANRGPSPQAAKPRSDAKKIGMALHHARPSPSCQSRTNPTTKTRASSARYHRMRAFAFIAASAIFYPLRDLPALDLDLRADLGDHCLAKRRAKIGLKIAFKAGIDKFHRIIPEIAHLDDLAHHPR